MLNQMVEYVEAFGGDAEEAQLDRVFQALADGTRRLLMMQLAAQPGSSITVLAARHEMSLNAVSKHLKVLEDAGLVVRRRDGRIHRCNANLAPFVMAVERVIEQQAYWGGRLDELEGALGRSVLPDEDVTSRGSAQ